MYEWSDRQGHRDRRAWLLLILPDGRVLPFTGEGIPGVVAIRGHDYEKDGKWSATTFRLELAAGARPVAGHDGWETGRFVEGLRAAMGLPTDTWSEVAAALGTTIGEAMRFLRSWRPKAAEALDAVDAALDAVDAASAAEDGEVATIAVSFGAPTRRSREAGFWGWPVLVSKDGHEVGRVTPGEGGWPGGQHTCIGQVRVLVHEHASGHGGGYTSLRLAVPAGAEGRLTAPAAPAPESGAPRW